VILAHSQGSRADFWLLGADDRTLDMFDANDGNGSIVLKNSVEMVCGRALGVVKPSTH